MTAKLSSVGERSRHARVATGALVTMLIMLTYEGALRKWVSSSLSIPLIGLRDLIAFGMVIYALVHGFLSPRKHVLNIIFPVWLCLVISWGLVQVVLGQNNFLTLIIGIRFWCLYLAFGIAIGQMLDKQGMVQFIRSSLWILILMAPLAVLQFLSPQDANINRQLDGDAASVFTVASGIVRTTGTFSFTLGYTTLLGLVTPLAVACFMEYRSLGISRGLAFAGLGAVALCTAVAGSRGSLIFFTIVIACGALIGLFTYRGKMKTKVAIMLASTFFFGLAAVAALPATVTSMQNRFQEASSIENLSDRILSIFIGDSGSYRILTWEGIGLGSGSGLGSIVATGSRQFVAGEAENGRILAEGGLFGGIYLMLKLLAILAGGRKACVISLRRRSSLPALVWGGFIIAFMTWPSSGQLTAHAALGVYVALALCVVAPPSIGSDNSVIDKARILRKGSLVHLPAGTRGGTDDI